MAFITLEKTWQRNRGESVGVLGYYFALALMKMKDLLVASGHWTVTQSSDSTPGGTGAGDNWAVNTDIVYAAEGVAHSWIVLRNTAIAANFEVCLSFNGANRSQLSVYCTHQGYNLDGTYTAKPTAVGGEQTVADKQVYESSSAVNWKVLVLTSSDGQCTRILFTNPSTSSGGCCGLWLFDRLKHPPSWMTDPYVVMAVPRSGAGDYNFLSGAENYPKYINYCHATGAIARAYHGVPIKVTFGSVGVTAALGTTAVGRICRADTGACPVYPVYAVSQTPGVAGFLGELYDIVWLPDNLGDKAITILNVGTVNACPLIYLPTADSDLGMFNWGAWAFGDTGEGGLF